MTSVSLPRMWHEQRREERRIKGMLVDRRKRAERRRDYWERIKADPVQFLQVRADFILNVHDSWQITI